MDQRWQLAGEQAISFWTQFSKILEEQVSYSGGFSDLV